MSQANTSTSTAVSYKIRPVLLTDVPQITKIVNHYIDKTVVNYSIRQLPDSHYANLISSSFKTKFPFYVAVDTPDEKGQIEDERILGFTCVSMYNAGKLGYATALEMSIYLDPAVKSRGLGTVLLNKLIDHLESNEYLVFGEGGASGHGSMEEPEGISVKCKTLLAAMAIDPDEKVDKQVHGFYLKNEFTEVGMLPAFGYKFGVEQSVRLLIRKINLDYLPPKALGGL